MSSGAGSSAEGHLRDLTRRERDALGRSVGGFVAALHCGESPDIADQLSVGGPALRWASLLEMIHESLEFRLKRGEPAGAGESLARFPELAGDLAAARDLTRAESRLTHHGAFRTACIKYL
jgi:hypothetical protein